MPSDIEVQQVLRALPMNRLMLLAALGHQRARQLLGPSVPVIVLERSEETPTWEAFSWWLDVVARVDSGALLAAGIVAGEMLLDVCNAADHGGDLRRMVDELRTAWSRGAANNCLSSWSERIRQINEAECALDSGGHMPPARAAARALSQLGFEFVGSTASDWLANAIEGLEHSTGLDRFVIEDRLRIGITQLVLGRVTP